MTDLDKELLQLMEFFQSLEPGKLPVDEVFKKTVAFFEKVQTYVEQLTVEQKKEASVKLVDLSQKLMSATKAFIDHVGLREDDLFTLMEKPTHFNEEQWKLMQESKRQITECAKKIATALIAVQSSSETQIEQQVKKKDTKKHTPPPRSSWMKS